MKSSKTEYCLLISGKIMEDLTKKIPGGTESLFKVKAEILMLSEEESRNQVTIKRLMMNRTTQPVVAFMCDEPSEVTHRLHSLERTKDKIFLALVIRGVL